MKKYIFIIISFTFIYYIIAGIFNLFFQQDEWRTFATYIQLETSGGIISVIKYYLSPTSGHFTPISAIMNYLFFKIYGLNSSYWFINSLALHSLTSCLVFVLAKKFNLSNKQSLVATLIFASAYAGNQAITWIAASTNTLLATSFGVISLIFFLDHLKLNRTSSLVLSSLFLYLSLLSKEIALGMFPFYILIVFHTPTKAINKKALYFKVILMGSIYLIFRFTLMLLPSDTPVVSLVSHDSNKLNYIVNTLLYPVKTVSQTVFPFNANLALQNYLFKLGVNPQGLKYGTTAADIFINKYLVTIFDLLIFSLLSLIIYLKRKNSLLIYAFTFIIFNSLIYVLSPERHGKLVAIDSRNLYLPMVGTAILISIIVKPKFFKYLILIIVFNLLMLRHDITLKSNYASLQKNIITTLTNKVPTIRNKTIFFVESDKSYFGLPQETKILPFQSGFGKTILVLYSNKLIFPHEYYDHDFLWDIESQGYLESGDYLFGYFRTEDKLSEYVDYNKPDQGIDLYCFSFNSSTYRLKEINCADKLDNGN